jgi:hypothetical protein
MWLVHRLLANSFAVAELYGKHTAILGGNMLTKKKLLQNVKMRHARQSRQVTGLQVFQHTDDREPYPSVNCNFNCLKHR